METYKPNFLKLAHNQSMTTYTANVVGLCAVDVKLRGLTNVGLHQREEVFRVVEQHIRSADNVVRVRLEAGSRSRRIRIHILDAGATSALRRGNGREAHQDVPNILIRTLHRSEPNCGAFKALTTCAYNDPSVPMRPGPPQSFCGRSTHSVIEMHVSRQRRGQ